MGLSEAIPHVIEAVKSATDNDPSTNPVDDLKQAALELVMPKLDTETLVDYAFESALDHIVHMEQEENQQNTKKKEENLYEVKSSEQLASKEELSPFKEQEIEKSYTATDYAEMRKALRNAGIKENESILTKEDIETRLSKKEFT